MTSLRVFEAVARHLTCTGAADELCMTQSAASKQIQALEEVLGVTLFTRINRGLLLTKAGQDYLKDIKPLLEQISEASLHVRNQSTNIALLTLTVFHILGDRWLISLIGEFTKEYPNIEIQFTTRLPDTDRKTSPEPDAVFMGGMGGWPGFVSYYLFGRDTVLLASPDILTKFGGLHSIEDVARFPLLCHFERPNEWNDFFSHHGIKPPNSLRYTRYEYFSMVLKAAVDGMGLALVPRVFAKDELDRGLLVNPLDLSLLSQRGYYIVVREQKLQKPELAKFIEWTLEKAKATRENIEHNVK